MNLDDTDINQLNRSWQTRMESVGRQFTRLAAEPVLDVNKDQMVHVAAMFLVPMPDGTTMVRLNVLPTDSPDDTLYSTSLENLEK